ncbi:MAG TPA: serine--tRNA ligase [Candidatus Paceibacterota bacterium]
MLDIRFIKENADLVREAARKKLINFNLDDLLAVDNERVKILGEVEGLRREQNDANDRMIKPEEDKGALVTGMKRVKEALKIKEDELSEVMKRWQGLMLQVPNIPDMSVPEGKDDSENKEVKKWGIIPEFNFTPKSHIDIMLAHDWADFERGAKVAGFRGYFLKGEMARLSLAIWQYGMKFFGEKGMTPMIVPSLVRRENLLGTGFLPQGEEDLYKTQDGEYLAGTAEVATMGYFMNETLDKSKLPIKVLSFSPCFRREAGAHGKDVKGLIRVHEFFKLEQVVICEASHEESVKMHEWLNRNTEEFIESLGIPYHTVINCGGDLGLGQVKKYDIELWVPLEGKYREISSASYFHDFQTRRLNIRYRDTDGPPAQAGKLKYTHSLNSTAIPTPRILVSLIENFQQSDGSVKLPEVLVPYMGKSVLN